MVHMCCITVLLIVIIFLLMGLITLAIFILAEGITIMTKTEELLNAVQALRDEETALFAFLTEQAQKLSDAQAALAAAIAAGNNDPQLQQAIDSINGVVSDINTRITPPVVPQP